VLNAAKLALAKSATETRLGVTLKLFNYPSRRCDELKGEGRNSPPAATSDEILAA